MSLPTAKPSLQSQLAAGDDKPPSVNPFSSIPTLASVAPAMHPKASDGPKAGAAAGLKATSQVGKDTRRGGGDNNDDEDNLSEISDDADEILNRQEVIQCDWIILKYITNTISDCIASQEAAAAAAAAASVAGLSAIGGGPFGSGQQLLSVNSGGFKPALLPTPAFKVGELPPRYIVPTLMPSHTGLHHHHHSQSGQQQPHHSMLHQQQQQSSHLSSPLSAPHHGHNAHFMAHASTGASSSSSSSQHLHANLHGNAGHMHSGAGNAMSSSARDKHDAKPPATLATDADLADLDFEDVSDGELEEEARIRRLGDALGVDWASLVDEARARARRDRQLARPAKQRWQAHRILLDVGVSFRRAGAEHAAEVLNGALRQLRRDEAADAERMAREAQELVARDAKESAAAAAAAVVTKAEPTEASETGGMQIKREIVDAPEATLSAANEVADPVVSDTAAVAAVDPTKTEDDDTKAVAGALTADADDDKVALIKPDEGADADGIQLFHPIACVQVASRASAEAAERLVPNCTGTYSRALCAERDVALRRQLCGLSEQPCGEVGGGHGDGREGAMGGRPAGGRFAAIARQLFEASLANVAAY